MSDNVDMKGLRKRATSGARWAGAATAYTMAAQIIQLAFLVRLLEVTDFGLMAMVNVTLAFAQTFGDAGVSNAIMHYRDARREELSSLYWLNVASGVLVCAVLCVVAPLVAGLYKQPALVDLLRVASLVFVLGPIGQQFQVLMERELRFRRLGAIEVTATTVSIATGITAAALGQGVWSLVWAAIAITAVKSLLLSIVGWSTWRPMLRFRPREVRRFLHFGLYQMGERTMNLLGQQLDKMIIGVLMGPGPLGYYDLAFRLVTRPYQVVNQVFTRVALSVFSTVQKDRDRLRKGYIEMLEVTGLLTIPIYVGMAALAPAFTRVQFGEGYEPIIVLLRILCIAGIMFAVTGPSGTILVALGRADVGFYLNLLRTALLAAAVWIGSRWGLSGIAWSVVFVAVVLMSPVHAYARWRLVGMTVGEFVGSQAPYLLSSLTAAAVCLAAHRFVPWPHAGVELAVMVPVAAAIYAGLLWWRARTRVMRIIRLART